MKLLLGPVLHAKEQTPADVWSFSVNLFLDSADASKPPPLRLSLLGPAGAPLFSTEQATAVADFSHLPEDTRGVVWRWDVTLRREDASQRVRYRFESLQAPGTPFAFESPTEPGAKVFVDVRDVVVPAKGALPRMAFFSCNGASGARAWTSLKDPFALWDEMRRQQEDPEAPGFQLLIGGGDQLYADSLWYTVPELVEFRKLSVSARQNKPMPDGFEQRVLAAYVKLYTERWGGEHGIAPMLARVPGLFTWDDHDIFDGWGSHETLQETPWFKALYNAAAVTYEAFQLGGLKTDVKTPRLADGEPGAPRHYLHTACFTGPDCDLDVVLLDLRSGRTSRMPPGSKKVEHVVMSEAQWKALDTWRAEHRGRSANGSAKKARHVLVVSSVPLVHMRFGPGAERMSGMMDLRDDLLDQWESLVHRGERVRLMMDLFTLAKESCCAVTVVSGDVHVGARALLRSHNPEHLVDGMPERAIEQVTSSAIVHPPPGALEFLGMRAMCRDGAEDLPSFLDTEMLPVGADLYLRERNWLALRVEPSKLTPPRPKLWIRWEAEHSSLSTQVVVEPPPLP
jgi:hypothetical protein